MKKLMLILLLAATVADAGTYQWIDPMTTMAGNERRPLAAESGPDASIVGDVTPQINELKDRMMHDSEIMTLLGTLQSDPEMLKLLNDPATMSAIQSGDIGTLMNNPLFRKLLDNPRVREIEKSLQRGTK